MLRAGVVKTSMPSLRVRFPSGLFSLKGVVAMIAPPHYWRVPREGLSEQMTRYWSGSTTDVFSDVGVSSSVTDGLLA